MSLRFQHVDFHLLHLNIAKWWSPEYWLTPPSHHIVTISFLWGENFQPAFLGTFQVCDTVSSAIITMLNMRSPELGNLITGCLYSLINIFLFPTPPTSPWEPPLYSDSLSSVFLDSLCQWDQAVFVFIWLISLSIFDDFLIIPRGWIARSKDMHFLVRLFITYHQLTLQNPCMLLLVDYNRF